MKTCSACGVEKPLNEFHRHRRSPDGRQYRCRVCTAAHDRARYAANPERASENNRRWRTANAEYRRAYDIARKSEESYQERERQMRRARYAENPSPDKDRARRRRALLHRATVETFTTADLLASWEERGLAGCSYCSDGEFEHIDHVVPLTRGGSHALANLVPACTRCNTSKGAKLLEEWLPTHQARLAAASA